MFFTNITITDKYNYLNENFQAGYKWLKETNIEELPVGAYPIIGEEVCAYVQEYTTIAPSEGKFETHEKYFDIQYVVSGKEQFGICKREGLVENERFPEKDLIFYDEPELSGSVLLLAGDLIVVALEDAHKPRLIAGDSCVVKKVVLKVRV